MFAFQCRASRYRIAGDFVDNALWTALSWISRYRRPWASITQFLSPALRHFDRRRRAWSRACFVDDSMRPERQLWNLDPEATHEENGMCAIPAWLKDRGDVQDRVGDSNKFVISLHSKMACVTLWNLAYPATASFICLRIMLAVVTSSPFMMISALPSHHRTIVWPLRRIVSLIMLISTGQILSSASSRMIRRCDEGVSNYADL